jgi:ATP-dependent phosphoenolpyruvate carboxykinase
MKPALYRFSGLSGTGKTTLALLPSACMRRFRQPAPDPP